jgi:hypothetical protein
MAEGFCARTPEQTDDAPSHDELLENQAVRLKEELKLAADFCINAPKTKVAGNAMFLSCHPKRPCQPALRLFCLDIDNQEPILPHSAG